MGNYIPKKATFRVVTGEGAAKVLAPVNKRAHHVMRKLGKRTKVTLAELRATSGKGSYKLCYYNAKGVIQPIR